MNTQVDIIGFGPHPDDVEISAAGTLLRMKDQGHRIGIIDFTAGEMGTRGSREIRAEETAAASAVLQLDMRENLDLGDGRLADSRENALIVVQALRRWRPKVVLSAWREDFHPDHEAAARILKSAVFLSGMAKVDTDQAPWRPGALLYYPARQEFRPSFVVDVTAQWSRREQAAHCYKSQFHNPDSTEPGTQISSPDFWHWVTARAMYYGQLIGVRYGEAFFVDRTLELDDPVLTFGRGL
ncbi:MAG: bacillithiol biosynthesis deacetylase BshB1 [Calditrichaeota bacterium]|nr:bacillithiol biosynthesis deacetylase BshB1 [Calditrichota bacterium]MCB9474112.1 bacillithiol biosynthesis deacetylase BshB1 [Candidatus Delongbacteria bacterium]